MRDQLTRLRRRMKEEGIDAYLVPTTDFHGSEYVNAFFKCREYMSGFTGSAGTLLVMDDGAWLWTDGRYFLQAADQLEGSGIELMKEGEEGVPELEEFLAGTLPEGHCLGFDGRVVSCALARKMAQRYRLRQDVDLVGDVWTDRPALTASEIYPLPEKFTGETMGSKLFRVREAMEDAGADYHLITKLEQVAWLCNLRGQDVENTPVFFAFGLLSRDWARFYVLDEKFGGLKGVCEGAGAAGADMKDAGTCEGAGAAGADAKAAGTCEDAGSAEDAGTCGDADFEVRPYFQIFEDLAKLTEGKILLDEKVVSYAAVSALPDGVEIIDGEDPAERMKAQKNPVEIESTQRIHVRDGAAMAEFIYWLKQNIGKVPMSELSASDYLEGCRRRQEGCYDLSFTTISGYMDHGAIVHYEVSPKSDKELKPEGFLLVDSGGQYDGGTTDITRTIALGPLSEAMRRHYTLVMKSHITLATAQFCEGTTGLALDQLTRQPLLAEGLNYNHGTGHGVGHMLSVHEGPCTISPRGGNSKILENMILSDEPGVYLEGQYGIRLENEVLCVKKACAKDGGVDLLGFEPLTWCPWEREALVKDMLTEAEIQWIDQYHRQVYEKVAPLLDEEVRRWLAEVTAPL